MTWIIILGAIVLVLAATVGGVYNKLVALKNRYKNAFAQIEVQLKRRYDLIPNLVDLVDQPLAAEVAVIAAQDDAYAPVFAARR